MGSCCVVAWERASTPDPRGWTWRGDGGMDMEGEGGGTDGALAELV